MQAGVTTNFEEPQDLLSVHPVPPEKGFETTPTDLPDNSTPICLFRCFADLFHIHPDQYSEHRKSSQ